MAEDGEGKLIAVARHIAKSIGRTDTMTDDILQIFSTFDGRFSLEKLQQRSDDEGDVDFSNQHTYRRRCSGPEHHLRSLDHQISRFVEFDHSIWSDRDDATAFLHAVDAVVALRQELDPLMPGGKHLVDLADDLIRKSMLRLEDELKELMGKGLHGRSPLDLVPASSSPCDSDGEVGDAGKDVIPVAQPVADYNIIIDALPRGTISDLYEIAKRMSTTGSEKICAHVYSKSRQDFLELSISRLGLHLWTTEEVLARPWQQLESEIRRWIHAVKVAVRVLFPSERRLCDRVFSDLSVVADLSFADVSCSLAIQLLTFADAVAVGSKAPERLFPIVDMYEALSDLLPEISSLFSDPYCSFLESEAATVCARLGATIRTIFAELENLIRRDPSKSALPGGGVHPITRYVMNYLRDAMACWRTLEAVMEEDREPPRGVPVVTATDQVRPSSTLAAQVAWIMEILRTNLHVKSKAYGDPALIPLFLINNGRYVIQKVKDTELMQVLGEDWIKRQMARVRQHHNVYQRTTWGKAMEVLQADGLDGPSSTKSLRKKLRMFNACLEQICQVQGGWVVADEQLRVEMRISAGGFVLPAYRNFLGRCRMAVGSGKGMERLVKYGVEDVEAKINELFEGSGSAAIPAGMAGEK